MLSCGHWCLFSPEEEVGNSQRVSNLPRSRGQPLPDSLSARWTLQCVSCREAEVPGMGLIGEERCTDVSLVLPGQVLSLYLSCPAGGFYWAPEEFAFETGNVSVLSFKISFLKIQCILCHTDCVFLFFLLFKRLLTVSGFLSLFIGFAYRMAVGGGHRAEVLARPVTVPGGKMSVVSALWLLRRPHTHCGAMVPLGFGESSPP